MELADVGYIGLLKVRLKPARNLGKLNQEALLWFDPNKHMSYKQTKMEQSYPFLKKKQ